MNILVIIVAVFLVFNIYFGFKKGMVHQIVSFVSLCIGGILILLVAAGLRSYVQGDFLNVLLVIVLLAAMAIIRQGLGAFFFSLKLVSKFPVLHTVDRLFGIVFGALETAIVLWVVYTLIMLLDLRLVGNMIKMYTSESPILLWFYQNNYIAFWFEGLISENKWTEFQVPFSFAIHRGIG